MGTRLWMALIPLLLLVGCSGAPTQTTAKSTAPTSQGTLEASAGASVPDDDPDLSHADSLGNTPEDVLLAYIRAWNRSDRMTVYSLTAPPKQDYASFVGTSSEDPPPWDDFEIHETRIVEPNRALVRVMYSTIGYSSLEGVPPEEQRDVVVVREPGEWWVLVKSGLDDARWEVTHKGPWD